MATHTASEQSADWCCITFKSRFKAAGERDFAILVEPFDEGYAALPLSQNGAASRHITLSLNGGSPVLVFVVPTNTSTKVFRVSTDTTGRNTASGNAVANAITALGINQITVGTALNANGVTYDVWAIKTGQVTP